jgi:hypothetical protein
MSHGRQRGIVSFFPEEEARTRNVSVKLAGLMCFPYSFICRTPSGKTPRCSPGRIISSSL